MGCDTCSTATVFTLTGGPTVYYSGREAARPPWSLYGGTARLGHGEGGHDLSQYRGKIHKAQQHL